MACRLEVEAFSGEASLERVSFVTQGLPRSGSVVDGCLDGGSQSRASTRGRPCWSATPLRVVIPEPTEWRFMASATANCWRAERGATAANLHAAPYPPSGSASATGNRSVGSGPGRRLRNSGAWTGFWSPPNTPHDYPDDHGVGQPLSSSVSAEDVEAEDSVDHGSREQHTPGQEDALSPAGEHDDRHEDDHRDSSGGANSGGTSTRQERYQRLA